MGGTGSVASAREGPVPASGFEQSEKGTLGLTTRQDGNTLKPIRAKKSENLAEN